MPEPEIGQWFIYRGRAVAHFCQSVYAGRLVTRCGRRPLRSRVQYAMLGQPPCHYCVARDER
jgi:hypothetical protein